MGFTLLQPGRTHITSHHPLAQTSHMVLPKCKGGWEVQHSSGRRREVDIGKVPQSVPGDRI